MARATIFIHIGAEKTGSTSLQNFLFENAPNLPNLGFMYPADSTRAYFDWIGHFPLAGVFVEDGQSREFVAAAKQQTLQQATEHLLLDIKKSPAKKIILSSEHFSSRVTSLDQIKKLRSILIDVAEEIKIIVYIRNQASLFTSNYYTRICGGQRETLNMDAIHEQNSYYNYALLLERWSTVFGQSNIIVREYSRSRLKNGDICEDFCHVIGLSYENLKKVPRQNESLDALSLETIRRLNAFLALEKEDLVAFRLNQVLRHSIIIPRLAESQAQKISISDNMRAQILNIFQDSNQHVNMTYFNGMLSTSWFQDSHTDMPDVSDSEISDNQVIEKLSALCIKLAHDHHDLQLQHVALARRLEDSQRYSLRRLARRSLEIVFKLGSKSGIQKR